MAGESNPVPNGQLEGVLDRLDGLSVGGLRAFWRERWGPPPPRLKSAKLLRLLIAWRLQAPVQGSLDATTRRRLRAKRPASELPAGTHLAREYRGVMHQVEVLGEGFLYRDRRYDSLSQVAETITGTHWNGPRFFGLRDARP